MIERVGNMLVQEGVVSAAQLEEALRNQVIFGGKIGTNLIELGYISPERLAAALSRHLGFPSVSPSQLHSIPAEVISLITADTAKKFQAIPINVEKKRVTIAMADPNNLDAIDRLAFMTGMYVNPVIVPELLLIMALERYYKIKRETRYIAIAQDMKREPLPREEDTLKEAPPTKTAKEPEPVQEDEYIEIPEFDGFHKVDIPELPETASAVKDGYSLADLCNALASASARDQIGSALMEYLRRRHYRAALLLPKEPVLTGWLAAGADAYIDNFANFRIEMQQPSSFLHLLESKNFSMGQLLSPTDFKAASALSANDNPALLLPIILMNRVVAIVCVIDTLEKLTRSLNELQKITLKSAMAFEILIMRNKIQMI